MNKWFVYILKCSDNSLYTGITTNRERRLQEHNESNLGAKYTKTRRPVSLLYFEECIDRSSATQRELEIKKLSKAQKLQLICGK